MDNFIHLTAFIYTLKIINTSFGDFELNRVKRLKK